MSPLTKARRRRSATNTPRCEQPGQSVGGRSGRSSAASGQLEQQALVDAGHAGLGELARHEARVELAAERQDVLAAVDLHALQADELLQERVELLDHVQLVDLGAEVGDEAAWAAASVMPSLRKLACGNASLAEP